jgi:neutral ceramidase
MLTVGFGVSDITPKEGMQMPGGFQKHPGKGIRDRLLAVACVIHDGTSSVALVGVDAIAIQKSTVAGARNRIEEATKIASSHVLVGASHTHSRGPVVDTIAIRLRHVR